MSETDILRYLVGALIAISMGIGGALITLLAFIGKRVLSKIDGLGVQLAGFDRRVTRLESRHSWQLYAGEGKRR